MPWVDPRKLITDARAGKYAIGAFNMHNDETTEALVLAAEEAQSPVFLQVGRAIVPHMGLRRAFEMTKRIAENSNASFVIHLDHGPWEECLEAIKLGFNSIMYDGAHLPFEENIKTTRRIVEIAHDFGIPVEAELGKIVAPDGGKARKLTASGLYVVELPGNASEKAVAARLARHPHLKFAELDQAVNAAFVPNDPYLGSQWHTTRINAPAAWDLATGAGVTIAVIDPRNRPFTPMAHSERPDGPQPFEGMRDIERSRRKGKPELRRGDRCAAIPTAPPKNA